MTVHVRDPESSSWSSSPSLISCSWTPTVPGFAKTAFGLRDWAREDCVGEFACAADAVDLGLPRSRRRGARARRARPRHRRRQHRRLHRRKLDPVAGARRWTPGSIMVSGLHARLADAPALREAAERERPPLDRHPHARRRTFPSPPARSVVACACSPSAPTARSARSTPRSRSPAPLRNAASRSTSAPPARPES